MQDSLDWNPTLPGHDIDQLLSGCHDNPFACLGIHPVGDAMSVRVFLPRAKSVTVLQEPNGWEIPAKQIHSAGIFEALAATCSERFTYRLRIEDYEGNTWEQYDPYSFGMLLGSMDLYLFSEGNHEDLHHKMGAHILKHQGGEGTNFAVWAPNAQRVSVVGDFNQWDGRVNPMRKHPGSGIWEIFLPGIGEGTHYKFEIRTHWGAVLLKSDPFAFYSQNGIQTASLVYNLDRYQWKDSAWMEHRKTVDWQCSPVSVYEVHLGSWMRKVEEENRYLSYIEFSRTLIPYVKKMGFTHIELMPVAEHPFDGSWGYQVTGYFAPTSRFGNPDEFRHFVDKCHEEGIGVIVDWVPGHFPKDAHGLAEFDGTALFEHADPRQGEHKDWGTLIFNYGRNEVRNFLISNAIFWLEQYHIDGLRVDAVASMLYLDYSRNPGEWIPNVHGGRENLEAIYFLKRFNEIAYAKFPGIMTIAEESTAWPGVSRPTYLGGLGFGFKWNMGWMHDFLKYMSLNPIYRRYHQGDITFSLIYAFHEHFMLVLSHDEVVHGKGSMLTKMPGDLWQKFANLRMFYAWMIAHPGKKLLFQGAEFGQWSEWNHDQSIDWHLTQFPLHDGLSRLIQHLNWLYKHEAPLWELDDSYEGFEWIDFHDSDNCVVAFERKAKSTTSLIFAVNATPVPRKNYRVGVPGEGFYKEVLNTDAQTYGGGNIGNMGGVNAEPTPWQGRSHSILVQLPPLAMVGFKRILPGSEPEPTPVLEIGAEPVPELLVSASDDVKFAIVGSIEAVEE